jgi:alginate O-acetyltransferase complex protein AlgI
VYQAAFMIVERLRGKKSLYGNLPLPIQIIITNIIVIFGWVIFRAPDLQSGVLYWRSMLGLGQVSIVDPLLSVQIFIPQHIAEMAACAIFAWIPLQAHDWALKLSPGKMILCTTLFLAAVAAMFAQTYNPFLYFQF